MATEDWETTCLIYAEETSSEVDDGGQLVSGSIDLTVSTAGPVFCRQIDSNSDRYRFWILEDELVLRITFVVEENFYRHVEFSLQSTYPASFPPKDSWLQWMEKEAIAILQEEQISYSVCLFLQERAFEFFYTLYQDDDRHLILFQDVDKPSVLQDSTIVATLCDQALIIPDKPHVLAFQWRFDNGTNTDDEPNTLVFERHYADGTISKDQQLSPLEAKHIFPLLVLWREWLPVHCKICFDTCAANESATITCGHSFCRDCISTYLCHKAEEVNGYKTNPFLCPLPECRRGMLIVGCVKQFLPPDLMDKVREWVKDWKNPPCYSLPKCLKKDCQGVMRRVAVDNDIVYCDECSGRWCELCLQRAPEDQEHGFKKCKVGYCVEFCKRYLTADEESQQRCEARWPWIKVYAKSRIHDDATVKWVKSNGQVCPGCKTGIERSEGCFHIKCHCGTHFCYLCGDEIFAPFYGTHHCWEREETFLPT